MMSTDSREVDRVVVAVGIDTTDVAEVGRSLERHPGRYLSFVLSAPERRETGSGADLATDVARRWAAKEAVTKVLSPGPDDPWLWPQVEILGLSGDDVRVRLHGRPAELAAVRGVHSFEITEHCSGDGTVTMTAVGLAPAIHQAGRHTTERQTSS